MSTGGKEGVGESREERGKPCKAVEQLWGSQRRFALRAKHFDFDPILSGNQEKQRRTEAYNLGSPPSPFIHATSLGMSLSLSKPRHPQA